MALELYAKSEISRTCMFLSTAKEIWESVCHTYSKVRDAAQMYELKTRIHNTKQGILSVTEYYNVIKSLWLELDQYQNLRMKCSIDATMHQEFIERERAYDFLAGLNVELDRIQVQIFGKEPLPSLNEAFAIVRGEEGRRNIMLEKGNTMDRSVLAISKPSGNEVLRLMLQTLVEMKGRKQVRKTPYGAAIARKIGTQGRHAGSSMASP